MILNLYDFEGSESHFMTHSVRDWDWFKEKYLFDPLGFNFGILNLGSYTKRWFLPMFSINNSLGNWIENDMENVKCTGMLDQEYKEQTTQDPGVESYNTIGYRNISENPDDPVAIISNRIDGWWGETPGDSGAGSPYATGPSFSLCD